VKTGLLDLGQMQFLLDLGHLGRILVKEDCASNQADSSQSTDNATHDFSNWYDGLGLGRRGDDNFSRLGDQAHGLTRHLRIHCVSCRSALRIIHSSVASISCIVARFAIWGGISRVIGPVASGRQATRNGDAFAGAGVVIFRIVFCVDVRAVIEYLAPCIGVIVTWHELSNGAWPNASVASAQTSAEGVAVCQLHGDPVGSTRIATRQEPIGSRVGITDEYRVWRART